MKKNSSIILALALPIVVLGVMNVYRKSVQLTSVEVILPITGYDPRHLLAGHYLMYQIDYGIPNMCADADGSERYLCLDQQTSTPEPVPGCQKQIKGVCQHGRFLAGVERFYVSDQHAKSLERIVQTTTDASIVLSVSSNGMVQTKDLLIKGQSWKEMVKANLHLAAPVEEPAPAPITEPSPVEVLPTEQTQPAVE